MAKFAAKVANDDICNVITLDLVPYAMDKTMYMPDRSKSDNFSSI